MTERGEAGKVSRRECSRNVFSKLLSLKSSLAFKLCVRPFVDEYVTVPRIIARSAITVAAIRSTR